MKTLPTFILHFSTKRWRILNFTHNSKFSVPKFGIEFWRIRFALFDSGNLYEKSRLRGAVRIFDRNRNRDRNRNCNRGAAVAVLMAVAVRILTTQCGRAFQYFNIISTLEIKGFQNWNSECLITLGSISVPSKKCISSDISASRPTRRRIQGGNTV